jgi:hypothetical protein
MHVLNDSKVALRDAVTRPSKRLSSWELLDLSKQNRTLEAELARQGPEPKKQQREVAYERKCDSGAVTITEGTILKKLRSMKEQSGSLQGRYLR